MAPRRNHLIQRMEKIEENKKLARWLFWLVAALVIVPSVGAVVPDGVHANSPPHTVLDLSDCTPTKAWRALRRTRNGSEGT